MSFLFLMAQPYSKIELEDYSNYNLVIIIISGDHYDGHQREMLIFLSSARAPGPIDIGKSNLVH